MHLVFFFYDLKQTAGIQRVIVNVSNLLVETGCRVDIIVADGLGSTSFKLDPVVKIHTINCPEPSGRFARLKKIIWPIFAYFKLGALINVLRPDCIVDHGTAMGLLWPFRKIFGVDLYFLRHFSFFSFPNSAVMNFFLFRFWCRKRLIVLTEENARFISSISRAEVFVIENFCDLSDVNVEYNFLSKEILAFGRAVPQKGFDLLIKAFAQVAIEFPGWTLRIIGPGVEEDSSLANIVESLSLVGRVQLLPATNAIDAEIRRSAFAVLPSRYEGFPMALLECLTFGLPVIASSCIEDVHRYVKNSGLVCDPYQTDVFAQCLKRMMQDEEMRRNMSAQVELNFVSREAIEKKWRDLLLSV